MDAEEPGPMVNPTFCFASSDPPRLVSVRGATESLLGYSQHQFLTSKVHLKDLIHPDDVGVAASVFSPDLGVRSGSLSLRVRHASGRIRCVKAHYTKKKARTGEKFLLESDARRRAGCARARRRSSADQFQVADRTHRDYIYVKNRNHVFLAASHNIAKLTESAHEPGEIVGKTDYDLLPEAVADVLYEMERLAVAEGRRVNEILQMMAQDGTKHWVDDRKYPINGPDGEIIGIFGVAPDITLQIEARQKLRESEELLQLFIEHAPAALAMFDREMRYLAVSRRWLEMHGLLGADILGRSHYEVVPEIPECVEGRTSAGVWRARKLAKEERRLVRADGTVQWVQREVVPWRTSDGSVGGIVIFAEDITAAESRRKSGCGWPPACLPAPAKASRSPIARERFWM